MPTRRDRRVTLLRELTRAAGAAYVDAQEIQHPKPLQIVGSVSCTNACDNDSHGQLGYGDVQDRRVSLSLSFSLCLFLREVRPTEQKETRAPPVVVFF